VAGVVARVGTEEEGVKLYRNQDIEDLAQTRLAQLTQALGTPLTLPIPIDLLAEKILGLNFLWEAIDELPGEIIPGALLPKKRLIVLNEKYLSLFEEKPGVERSTKGHEMGHWDLFIDKATLEHPTLFDGEGMSPFLRRRSALGDVFTMQRLLAFPEGQHLLYEIRSRADDPDEARAVNRYAAAISMPKGMLCEEALKINRTNWSHLYELAKKFEVTISALTVRLSQFNLLYIKRDDKQTMLYESPDDAVGQMTLGL
jgi:hypothetical protein